jgi:hypothetical protein
MAMRGTIKHLWKGLHYGMIRADDKSIPELFFYVGDVNGLAEIGDRVSFEPVEGFPYRADRPRAVRIILNPAEPDPAPVKGNHMANGKSHTPRQSKAPSMAPQATPKKASGDRKATAQKPPATSAGVSGARDAGGKC